MSSTFSKRKFPGRKQAGGAAAINTVGVRAAKKRIIRKEVVSQSAKEGKSLAHLQAELDLLISYASDTVYRLHYATMSYDYISPTVTKLLGFSVEEMKKLNFRSLIVETRIVTDGLKNVKSFDELEGKRRAGDVNKWQADYLIRTKDGRKIWVSDVSYPWFDEKGYVIGSTGSLRDITDRVVAEEKIRKELQQLSNLDTLTGIANRKQFFDEVDRELKRINRSESDVAMLLISIDHYKELSEHYSQDIAEMVLRNTTKVIGNALRVTDFAARLGGEEFGVLLPETGLEGATELAKRVRNAVLKHPYETGSDKTPIDVTVSIGIASAVATDQMDASSFFKLADTRMYIAKNAGQGSISFDNLQLKH